MKTTIDLDEARLRRVMKLTGLKTRKATIDFALLEAERAAKLARLLGSPLPDGEFRDAVDPDYDLTALRSKERPLRK